MAVPSGSILDILIAAARHDSRLFWSARYDTAVSGGPLGFMLGYLVESAGDPGQGASRALYRRLPQSMSAP